MERFREAQRFGNLLKAARHGFKLFQGCDVLFRLTPSAQEEYSVLVEVCSLGAFQDIPVEILRKDFLSWESKNDQIVREKVKSGLLEHGDFALSPRLKYSQFVMAFVVKDN